MSNNYSVLMSVYFKEKPEFLKASIQSVLDQTYRTDDFVIICDGPLTKELDGVLEQFVKEYAQVNVYRLKENKGLGHALKYGIQKCKNDIVARMDSDDISVLDRCEIQLKFLNAHESIAVVGGYISEFYDMSSDIKHVREVPLSNMGIVKAMKTRNAMNHVTVMFRKQEVLKSGNYQTLLFLEDYYLWIRMILNNKELANIPRTLVLVRTGEAMYQRRSNRKYINSWDSLQKYMLDNNLINKLMFLRNKMNIRIFIYMPNSFRKILYKYILRRKK